MKKYNKPIIKLLKIEAFTILSGSGSVSAGGFTSGDESSGIGVIKNDPHHGGEDEL